MMGGEITRAEERAVLLDLAEERVEAGRKHRWIAYALWLVVPILSLHRWYLGDNRMAILQSLSWLVGIGPFWWLIDTVLIPRMVREHEEDLRAEIITDLARAAAAIEAQEGAARARLT